MVQIEKCVFEKFSKAADFMKVLNEGLEAKEQRLLSAGQPGRPRRSKVWTKLAVLLGPIIALGYAVHWFNRQESPQFKSMNKYCLIAIKMYKHKNKALIAYF